MGLRFLRLRLLPRVRLSVSNTAVSTGVGGCGAPVTFVHGKARQARGLPDAGPWHLGQAGAGRAAGGRAADHSRRACGLGDLARVT